MLRLLAISLLLLVALPVRAQFAPFVDPAVWVSTSFGPLAGLSNDFGASERDNFAYSFSVAAVSHRWMAQGGLQISDYWGYFSDDPFISLWGSTKREGPATYRSLYAVGGPYASSRWFMGGVAVGPALTWGTRQRVVPCAPVASVCTADLRLENEAYLNPSLAGSVQGFVRLDGRVWLGGETMLVVNTASTHLATRLALRIDLLRPDR